MPVGYFKRSLRVKLLTTIAIPMAFAIGVGALGLYELAETNHRTHELTDLCVPRLVLSEQLNQDLYQLTTADAKLLLATTDSERSKATALADEQLEDFDERIAALNAISDEYLAPKLHTIDNQMAQMKSIRRRFLETIDAGENQAAVALLKGELYSAVEAVEATLEEIAEHENSAMQAAVEHTYEAFAFATKLVIGTLIVGSALAAILAILITNGILGSLKPVIERAGAIANRDLSGKPLATRSRDEVGQLVESINKMSSSLNTLVSEVRASATEVAAAATEVSASSEELSKGVEEQSGQLRQVSSAVEQMSASISEVADKSTNAAQNATNAGAVAQQGAQVVGNTVSGMQQIDETVNATARAVDSLGERSQKIGEVVEVINEIAEQTNLLALNAAIEAARAGEHGRGFAVVADEVRKLADRTTKATQEIAESISLIQNETTDAVKRMGEGTDHVRHGVELATQAGSQLKTIVDSSREVANMIQSIAAAAEQQSAASTEISSSVERIAAVSQQTTQAVAQSSQAATELSQKAERLQELVTGFRL
ncbi:MAG: methyl-accepting chemotaxis protein [Phycisphaerales bacterium]